VLGALYYLHRGARRGVATSEAGEEAWPPSPRDLIEASANIVGRAESMRALAVRHPVSVSWGWGAALPFIGQGGSRLHACRTISTRVAVWRIVS
jgi:hypothetical protein